MKKSNVILVEQTELRTILKEFYGDILKDSLDEILSIGSSIVPPIILQKGVDNLSVDELIEVSNTWTEVQMDMNPNCDGIIMVGVQNHLLTPDMTIDMQKNKKTKKQKILTTKT